MTLETFFEKFELFADAPNAVVKMRELIVQSAVRGDLVPNDSNEQPVQLIMTEDSQDDSLPSNWRWGVLGDALQLEYGENLPSAKRSGSGEYPVYGSNGVVGTHDTYLTKEPAIIVGRKGSAGALNIAAGPSWTTDVAYFVRPPSDLDLRYTYYLLSSLHLDQLGKGIKPGLSRKEAYELPIPLPPLAEQKRIVAKVDELMALCDRLEAQQRERDTQQAALARAAVARFADAPTSANIELLFHKSCSVSPADLRKTILTLAVQGNLVPQDPNDEPASVLLKHILLEKERLVREGKIRREASPVPATVDELQFELRPGWEPAMIGQILVELQTGPFGSSLHKSDYQRGGIPVINPASIKNEQLVPIDGMAIGSATLARLATFKLRAGDIVMARRGEMGRCAVVTDREEGWLCGTGCLILRLPECVFPRFFMTVIGSPFVREYLGGSAVGITMQNLNQSILLRLVIGLPPLAEQRRIVAKVDQLMVLVDQLEAQLAASRAAATVLMEALVAELTQAGTRTTSDTAAVTGKKKNAA